MPLRKGYSLAEVSCKEAYAYFGFREDLETLMVIGGSQGADICNQLAEYIQKPCQVLHLSGKKADPENILAVYRKKGISAIVKPFETNMQYAWRVADCWVGRSGSSTLAEALAFEVPGLLIPYPYATGGHQELNARFFCETVGGGLVLPEREISFALFNHHFETLWKDRLLRRAAIQAYKCNGSRPDFVELVWEVLGE